MFKGLKDKANKMVESGKNMASEAADRASEAADKIAELTPDAVNEFKEKAGQRLEGLSDEYITSNMDEIESYCSWCFEKHLCTLIEKNSVSRNIYICDGCRQKVVKCRACDNKAKYAENTDQNADEVGVWTGNFCAIHGGEIASFERLNWKLDTIGEYRLILEREDTNYKKIGTTAAFTIGGAAVIAPLAFIAAPAIGGAVGTSLLSYSGAAATSSGLATLGGGALAAGGAGMAGGIAVVTAAGSALGGRYGAVISNSYYGDIDGFDLVKIKPGSQPTVLCIDGFLTQDDKESSELWLQGIKDAYPDNEVYHVHWESKRLRDLGTCFGGAICKQVAKNGVTSFALSASKFAATKLAPIGVAFQVLGLANNPWSIASLKAYQTGAVLADIIARTDREYILMGHSLGARVAYSCMSALATKDQVYIDSAHLFGGAINNTLTEGCNTESVNWFGVHKSVANSIYNYHSNRDTTLEYLYKVGESIKFEAGEPIGRNRVSCSSIGNIDVSEIIGGHTVYKAKLAECIKRSKLKECVEWGVEDDGHCISL